MIFRTILSTVNIGLRMYGRARWQEAGATMKDFSNVLTRLDKKFFTFELFKVIEDSIPLIFHYRTMNWFRTTSSGTFIILDVRSIYTPQIQDWYREDKILAGTDRRYSLQPWIPCIRITTIQKSLIWPNHVLHLTNKSGKCTKIRCTGSIYSLLNGKDWRVYRTKIERSHPLRYTPSLLYLESNCDEIWRNHTPESVCVTRPPPTISYKDNWTCNLDSDVCKKQ